MPYGLGSKAMAMPSADGVSVGCRNQAPDWDSFVFLFRVVTADRGQYNFIVYVLTMLCHI